MEEFKLQDSRKKKKKKLEFDDKLHLGSTKKRKEKKYTWEV